MSEQKDRLLTEEELLALEKPCAENADCAFVNDCDLCGLEQAARAQAVLTHSETLKGVYQTIARYRVGNIGLRFDIPPDVLYAWKEGKEAK